MNVFHISNIKRYLRDKDSLSSIFQYGYNIYPQLRQAWANSIDPDQGLHCLSLIQLFLDTYLGSHTELFKF